MRRVIILAMFSLCALFAIGAIGCRKKPNASAKSLHWAVQTGNVQQIKSLLAGGADVNAKDQNGWTPLHWAAKKGQIKAAELLIASGADINATENNGWTPLFLAIPAGDANLMTLFLTNGADVNMKCGEEEETPLHIAAREGNAKASQILLDNGANINSRDKQERTPLNAAVSESKLGQARTDLVKRLIAYGAEINAKDINGSTPLQTAISTDDLETVELIVAAGANANERDMYGTPLANAVGGGQIDIAKVLLSGGAKITGPPEKEEGLLILAASAGFEELARRLLYNGVDANSPAGTGMALACSLWQANWQYLAMMPSSVQISADPTAGFGLELTNVWRESNTGHRDVAILLITHGANVNIANTHGR